LPVTIYHNPRCSKSRQTLKLLEERNIRPEIVEYLRTPPDTETLTYITKLLGLEPRQLMRTGEAVYREKGLGDESLTPDQLIAAMVENPILIERPIVVAGNRARIGRPPEKVLEIL
jgi:arsenate reductase